MMPRDDLTVSPLNEENVAAAAALCAACFSSPWPESVYRRQIGEPRAVGLVCTDRDGRAAGFIFCDYVVDELTLNTLAVRPDCRRQGIAEMLYLQAEAAVSGICTVCYLEVRESNIPARKLYEKLGFVQNGYRPRYYHDPDEAAVLMEKRL